MRKVILIVVISLLGFGCATPSKRQDLEVQKLHTQLTTLEQRLRESEKEVEELESQLDREREMRRRLERQLVEKRTQLEKRRSVYRPTVKNIQEALRRAGFYSGPVDGILGSKTKKAIKDFQKSKGLKVDGIVGKRTWEELSKYLVELPN